MQPKKPVMLIILDGWGIREMEHGNAVVQGNTANYDHWMQSLERSILDASGPAVGLTPDQMGNSEVGHLNLGAGRIVYQDITRIEMAIHDDTLRSHPVLTEMFDRVRAAGQKLHLIGLLGSGGVHSHDSHLYALLRASKAQHVPTVIHVITDGRDTPPNSGKGYLQQLVDWIAANDHGAISTVSGRYYAMDRDKRWERTARAYNAMAAREADRRAPDPLTAVQQSYDADVSDEFILPTVVGDDDTLKIMPGDALLFYNFRADRVRQITDAFARDDFAGAEHFTRIPNLEIITFTEYSEDLPAKVMFAIELLQNTLAETLSKHGCTQYHSAETEKYPHVTYFFNGRNEEMFPGESRVIVPSPKVATYDLKPEMSAYELRDATLERLREADDDFLLINFANPDMVGHTGSLTAAIKAVEVVDECAGALVRAVKEKGGVAIVTADHGNCERMIEEATGEAHTYHTTNPVSLFVIGDGYYRLFPRGILADVAPTVLHLLGIEQPIEMTGRSLVDVYVADQPES